MFSSPPGARSSGPDAEGARIRNCPHGPIRANTIIDAILSCSCSDWVSPEKSGRIAIGLHLAHNTIQSNTRRRNENEDDGRGRESIKSFRGMALAGPEWRRDAPVDPDDTNRIHCTLPSCPALPFPRTPTPVTTRESKTDLLCIHQSEVNGKVHAGAPSEAQIRSQVNAGNPGGLGKPFCVAQ